MRKSLLNMTEDLKGNIRVIVRCRPFPKLNDKNINLFAPTVRVSHSEIGENVRVETANGERNYSFYRVFGPNAKQKTVFEEVRPLMQYALDGHNICVIAYGPTGSGKTYTIMGKRGNGCQGKQGV
ncbi:MAG: putative Kinesin KP1 [Streblomastix strix]|uniref:Putative Kinesin KP1 n=1 Tax=Streblomastix strix TaxID=222440 RepID=A0A5J4VMV1_9EUKA|nr:MAG: putative Kinesin KP1 [Streblomastix strix]